ncbi:MAG: endopeptidase La [Candidatus Omnitrophica bacterium]|jgi:ATP-dependent Lon protease|nr:endopeptidase La [Candidatus Omnitrophota bacterium]
MAILKKNNSLKKEAVTNKEIPFVPIRDMVLFPYMVLPLLVGRQRSINAVEEALSTDGFVVLGFQNDPMVEDPQLNNLYPVGIYAKIIQSLREPNGTMKILIESIERVQIIQLIQGKKYFSCVSEKIKEEIFKDKETEALMRFVMDLVQKYLNFNAQTPKEFYGTIIGIEEPDRLSDTIAGYLPLKIKDKAKLLEIFNVKNRLKVLIDILNSEINVLEVQKEIQEKVVKKIEQTQKEYLLHEQLKTIQQELGKEASENPEITQLAEKIKAVKMKPEAEAKALEELNRLAKTMPLSPEATVIRTYLDWLINLPWGKNTQDNLDIKNAEHILNEDHYGLEKPKERILEYLAVRKRTDSLKGPILCFVGPPGVGKTSLGKSIARCLGRKFVRVSLGGVRDEAEIRGHRRTYIGALPGRIMQSVKKAGVNNPVFLLDEVDKIGIDFRGDPSSALLEVLDPEQNFAFSDHYLEVEFDLSNVLFITTANNEFTIPSPLLDRMEVINLPGYSIWEKLEIAKNFLIPKILTTHGLKKEEIKFADSSILKIIKDYTLEAGVRNLERELANICRKVTRKIVEGNNKSFHITFQNISSYLGPEKYSSFSIQKEPKIGVATGMAWTEYGGDILFTEIGLMKGKGNLILTGKLGDVMKESAQAALSFVRANADRFNISPDFYEKIDIHIHVPEGAIPKDGPSAGVTITTAIVSALSKKYVRNDVAMTGEITLQGKVLKIGGLKSKILAAHRSGIKTVIIPKENEGDLEEIPKKIRQDLKIILVSNIFEVLDKALIQSPLQ